jgi:hypothetical protein
MKIVMYLVGFFRGTVSRGFFELFVPNPPRVDPFGVCDRCKGGSVEKISYHIRIVQFSWEMLKYKHMLKGVSPPPLWLPRSEKPPNRCSVSSSLIAGAVWGDLTCPHRNRTSILNFLSREKGFTRAKFFSSAG